MKAFRRAAIAGAALAALLAVAIWLLFFLELRVSLNGLRDGIAQRLTQAIGRTVTIEGDFSVVPSLWPTLGVERVTVENAPGFGDEPLARLDHARGRLSLLALLRGDLVIDEISVSGVRVALATDPDGRGNWPLGGAPAAAGAGTAEAAGALEIRQVRLREVLLHYEEGSSGRAYALAIELLEVSLDDDQAQVEIRGRIDDEPLELSLVTGALEPGRPWALALSGALAGVPVNGEVALDVGASETRLDARLAATESPLGGVASLLLGRDDVEGRFASLGVTASSHGGDLGGWLDNLALELQLADAHFSFGTGPEADREAARIDEGVLALPAGGALTGSLTGSLGEQALTLTFAAGTARSILDALPQPLALRVEGRALRGRVDGLLEMPRGGYRLHLELAGDTLGALAPLLGVPAAGRASFSVSADLLGRPDGLEIHWLDTRIGETRMAGTTRLAAYSEGPFLDADLHFTNLVPAELEANLAPPEPDGDPGLTLDIPVLPSRIEILDVDARVHAERVVLGGEPVTDLAFEARVRADGFEQAPFRMRFGGLTLAGRLALDLGGEQPALSLRAVTDDADLGEFARRIGLAEGLDLTAARLGVAVQSRGHTLRQLADAAVFEADLHGGRWRIEEPDLDGSLRLGIETGTIRAAPGEPLRVDVDGSLDRVAVGLEIETEPLSALLIGERDVLPMRLHATFQAAELDLVANLALPIQRQHTSLDVSLHGRLLADLEPLLGVALPPIGPYALEGTLDAGPGRYEAHFDLTVGESRLTGEGHLTAGGGRPTFAVELDAATVQLHDFPLGGWSPLPEDRESAGGDGGRGALLSAEVLRAQDGTLRVDVEDVRSGSDRLGSGSLVARLEAGRLSVDSLEVDIPGGTLRARLAVEPGDTRAVAELRAEIEKLDYGILARRLAPGNDTEGLVSLDLDLVAEAPDLGRIVSGTSGRFDVAVWPRNYAAGALELWSVNLVLASLRRLAPGPRPQINCAIGLFDMTRGRLDSRAILIDTTRVQVAGRGQADFVTEQLEFELVPRPKRAQFLSLATPVVARGSFSDFRTLVTAEAAVGTVIRQATSVLTVPFSWMFGASLPRDGDAACTEVWRKHRLELGGSDARPGP